MVVTGALQTPTGRMVFARLEERRKSKPAKTSERRSSAPARLCHLRWCAEDDYVGPITAFRRNANSTP